MRRVTVDHQQRQLRSFRQEGFADPHQILICLIAQGDAGLDASMDKERRAETDGYSQ